MCRIVTLTDLCIAQGEDMEKKLGEKLEEHVKKYTNTTESQKLLDDLQKEVRSHSDSTKKLYTS